MAEKITGKVFDYQLFKRLMNYAKKYRLYFFIAAFSVIAGAILAAVNPVLIKEIVDNYLTNRDPQGLLNYAMLMVLVLVSVVLSQFAFIYFANWLGQHIIKDIRIQLFDYMLRFKMQYFTNSPVGKLVTRVVSDIETISSIFAQGLFMIISDLLKMLVISGVMLWMNWLSTTSNIKN